MGQRPSTRHHEKRVEQGANRNNLDGAALGNTRAVSKLSNAQTNPIRRTRHPEMRGKYRRVAGGPHPKCANKANAAAGPILWRDGRKMLEAVESSTPGRNGKTKPICPLSPQTTPPGNPRNVSKRRPSPHNKCTNKANSAAEAMPPLQNAAKVPNPFLAWPEMHKQSQFHPPCHFWAGSARLTYEQCRKCRIRPRPVGNAQTKPILAAGPPCG